MISLMWLDRATPIFQKVELGNIAEKAFKPYARGESQGRQLLFALYTREAPMQERHPCLLTHLPHFFRQAKGKRLTVFMDYDGGSLSLAASFWNRMKCCSAKK